MKEATGGILAFFGFTCLAYHSRYLQIFVSEICVHCQLHIVCVVPPYPRGSGGVCALWVGGLFWFWAIWPKVPTTPKGGGGV